MEFLELLTTSLRSIFFIIIYSFLIFYISKSNLDKFSKAVFIIGFSAIMLNQIILLLRFNLDITAGIFATEIFSDVTVFRLLNAFLFYFGSLLMLSGISFIIPKNKSNNEIQNIDMVGEKRSIGVSFFLFFITLGLYFPFWLYRTVKDLRRNFGGEFRYTPGQAVGFLFIPVFNIYWAFYLIFSLPKAVSEIEKSYFNEKVGFNFHPVLISILLLLLPIISNLHYIAFLQEPEYIGDSISLQLFFFTAIIFLWIIIQAKINTFFDFKPNLNKELTND